MTEQPATEDRFVENEAEQKAHQNVPVKIGSAPERPTLDDAQRERLAAFADRLIAGGAGLPSASAADVHKDWIDRALAARPDLAPVVESVLAQDGDPQDVLDRLRADGSPAFGDFAFVVAGAYLINPRIRKAFGYPAAGPARNPAFEDEADAYLEDGILDVVIERGPIYRPTPTAN